MNNGAHLTNETRNYLWSDLGDVVEIGVPLLV
jgi:hypothetical protein